MASSCLLLHRDAFFCTVEVTGKGPSQMSSSLNDEESMATPLQTTLILIRPIPFFDQVQQEFYFMNVAL
jgi:hypothetical protein